MQIRTSAFTSVALVVAATACKAPEAAGPAAPEAPGESAAPGTPEAARASPPNSPTDSAAPAAPSAAPTAVSPSPGAPSAAPNERPGPPLPELRVKSFGLHVGGAAKDTEQRHEVQRTLERGFPRYLDCYRLIEEPGSEGTFGADLRVGVDGGRPKVEHPRTALRGEAFRACMIKAFESARFDAPSSGRAVVVSYSVKFSFGW